MTTNPASTESLTWEASLSMLTSTVLIRQLALVLGVGALSVSCLLVALSALEGNLSLDRLLTFAWIGAGIFVGLLLLSAAAAGLFYRGRYHSRYTLHHKGIHVETSGPTRRANGWINLLLIISGRPAAAGAGLLAASRQSQAVHWDEVDHLSADPRTREICLYRGRRVVMLVQCTPENYPDVLLRIEQRLHRRHPPL